MLQSMGWQRVGHNWATELNKNQAETSMNWLACCLLPALYHGSHVNFMRISGDIYSTVFPEPGYPCSWSLVNTEVGEMVAMHMPCKRAVLCLQFIHSVTSDSLGPPGLQHTSLSCDLGKTFMKLVSGSSVRGIRIFKLSNSSSSSSFHCLNFLSCRIAPLTVPIWWIWMGFKD